MEIKQSLSDKKYFSISEVSEFCKVKQHTLRFWEKEFKEINPLKRRGRRYYQKEDILIIQRIKSLLYETGLTISGVKKELLLGSSSIEQKSDINIIQDLEEILEGLNKIK